MVHPDLLWEDSTLLSLTLVGLAVLLGVSRGCPKAGQRLVPPASSPANLHSLIPLPATIISHNHCFTVRPFAACSTRPAGNPGDLTRRFIRVASRDLGSRGLSGRAGCKWCSEDCTTCQHQRMHCTSQILQSHGSLHGKQAAFLPDTVCETQTDGCKWCSED